jgi:hypothetical protein
VRVKQIGSWPAPTAARRNRGQAQWGNRPPASPSASTERSQDPIDNRSSVENTGRQRQIDESKTTQELKTGRESREINELGRRRLPTPSAWEETQHEGSGSEESQHTNDGARRRASGEIGTGEKETQKRPIPSATPPKQNRPAAREL